jgi:hypothetical protein
MNKCYWDCFLEEDFAECPPIPEIVIYVNCIFSDINQSILIDDKNLLSYQENQEEIYPPKQMYRSIMYVGADLDTGIFADQNCIISWIEDESICGGDFIKVNQNGIDYIIKISSMIELQFLDVNQPKPATPILVKEKQILALQEAILRDVINIGVLAESNLAVAFDENNVIAYMEKIPTPEDFLLKVQNCRGYPDLRLLADENGNLIRTFTKACKYKFLNFDNNRCLFPYTNTKPIKISELPIVEDLEQEKDFILIVRGAVLLKILISDLINSYASFPVSIGSFSEECTTSHSVLDVFANLDH